MGVLPLAVTGGIAEGKSTVVGYLAEAGFRCVSADDLVRSVVQRPEVAAPLGTLRRKASAETNEQFLDAMASDVGLRRRVNALLHAPVVEAMLDSDAQVFEVPLLFETCLQGLFHRVWVVTCGPEEQIRRLTMRTGDEGRSRRLIASQLSSDIKVAFADRIVRTNQPPFDVHSHVVSLASQLSRT